MMSKALEELRQFDTCAIANAIERFGLRLKNEGFTRPGLRCFTGDYPTALGRAVTCRVKTANPPMTGQSYYERTDWWDLINLVEAPRIVLIEDLDGEPGLGSFVGEVHSAILAAMECAAAVTNGAVRDLPAVREMGFPLYGGAATVSHAYAHMVDHGEPVSLFGLEISCGELVAVDCHGLLKIPVEIVEELVAAVREIAAKERKIVDLCRSSNFSLERLKAAVRGM
ncbi:MAG: RraA family protein [Bryobacterales bacterium]|nr:RraA family protein [Bryobacterales bacterium]